MYYQFKVKVQQKLGHVLIRAGGAGGQCAAVLAGAQPDQPQAGAYSLIYSLSLIQFKATLFQNIIHIIRGQSAYIYMFC